MRQRASVLLPFALVFALALPAGAKGSLADLEQEFKEAIQVATPATVTCVAWEAPERGANASSGVLVTESGYVLSDGDVGAVARVPDTPGGGPGGGAPLVSYENEVEVRVPDLEQGGFTAYRAGVVRRVRGADTCLLKIENPPPGGFDAHLVPWTSRDVRVGDFGFAVGNSFGLSDEAPPALTAGIVAATTPLAGESGAGAIEFIYTSAAVNPGVNGGPAVDVEGRLVGTVSTWGRASPGEPYQFLGKIVPIDRIRAAYADLPEAAEVFPEPEPTTRVRAKSAAMFERVLRHVASGAAPAVVSLEVERATPLSVKSFGQRNHRRGVFDVVRWLGPVSGVLLDSDGWIVTSLYNLTNVMQLVEPLAPLPPDVQVETGLMAIKKVTAHFPDGRSLPAKVVAYDGRLGIALLKAETGDAAATTTTFQGALPPAPPEAFEAGRFVLAIGNPFGKNRELSPLLSFGILSKVHSENLPRAWRGQWQTDAGVTDTNCGGALVDLKGRLLGILHVWGPLMHGRNSGIGFVVPWPAIEEALPRLQKGESLRRGQLGVTGSDVAGGAHIDKVTPDSPAGHAGIRDGDTIVALDGRPVSSFAALVQLLAFRWEGEEIELRYVHGSDEKTVRVRLAPRS